MQAIVVEVRRNGAVEARHLVHAVAVDPDGVVIARAGDAEITCFMRSSSKPIQALPLARARPDLDDSDLAIAAASHHATPDQIAAVRRLLAKAPAEEDDLECGLQEGRPPERIYHNCSGKHAGMLALCKAQSWPTQGYRLPDHPVQEACAAAHREAAETEPAATATDGCGVVTFAYPLHRMARAFARLPHLSEGARITKAMRSNPHLVGGADGADVLLMQAQGEDGWFAKGGAEGLLCAGTAAGIGIALKAEDGASRPLGPALAEFAERAGALDLDLPTLRTAPVTNSRGELVGELSTPVRK